MVSIFDLKARKHDSVSNHSDENTYSLLKVQITSYDVEHNTKSIVTIMGTML